MALPARCARVSSSLLRQRCLAETRPATLALRSYSTQTAARSTASALRLQQKLPSSYRPQQLRAFSSSLRRLASEAENPPSSKAYFASGVLKDSENLVDVKKVLVIGSGGLSIGQAGEFDYSGKFASLGGSSVQFYSMPAGTVEWRG